MKRDEQIQVIVNRLNDMIGEENKKIQYDAIMTLANHNMNINLFVDENKKHHLMWTNRKCQSTFDDNVHDLLEYIQKIDV